MLAEAFGETDADVELLPTAPIENVKANGEIEGFQSGPVLQAVGPSRRAQPSRDDGAL